MKQHKLELVESNTLTCKDCWFNSKLKCPVRKNTKSVACVKKDIDYIWVLKPITPNTKELI